MILAKKNYGESAKGILNGKHTKLTLKVRIYYKDKYDGSLFLS